MSIRFATVVTLFMIVAVNARAQEQPTPVWVPQAPPFGTIDTFLGIPDLRSVRAMAGPAVTDIRVAEWSPLRHGPAHFLRLVQVDNEITPTLLLWWYGGLGPAEPPANPRRQCTAPVEGPRICIEPVSVGGAQDWNTFLRMLLAAEPCKSGRPTDGLELRLQAFQSAPARQYREVEICGPLAKQAYEFFDGLSAHVSRSRK